ncbi:hypothetical protein ACHAWF_006679, partial [Thalassiosira exigua]
SPHIGDKLGFYNLVQAIAAQKCPTPSTNEFKFDFSQEAADHNSSILEKYDFDLEKAIKAQPFSTTSMGSELRPPNQLDLLYKHHPNHDNLLAIATKGAEYPDQPLSDSDRKRLTLDQIEAGNQQSTQTDEAIPLVTKLMMDDVSKGYAFLVSTDCLTKLKDAEVYPMGLAHQTTIDEQGNTIPKKRVTHNLSARKKFETSINQRVHKDDLPPTHYGFALLRALHKIHHIRWENPKCRILGNKVDIDKAYRRLHASPRVAAKCCSTWFLHKINDLGEIISRSVQKIGSILTRLPFGSSPAPAIFSQFSECTFDLAEDLMNCELWDPNILAPPLHEDVPQPVRLPDNIPFGEALEADVKLPLDLKGGTEGYIDDGTSIVLDTLENIMMVERARLCSLMSLFLTCRPLDLENEPINRSPIASIRKLLAEGGLTEILIFLGWLINTRLFTIGLPTEKATAWKKSIHDIINKKWATYDSLKTLVGRLEHACFVIPSARHFMNRLRRLKDKADKYKSAKIDNESMKDLILWIKLLNRAEKGISINNVIFRSPSSTVITDASETGIGGYCLSSDYLWRYPFSILEQRSFTLNTKEYI